MGELQFGLDESSMAPIMVEPNLIVCIDNNLKYEWSSKVIPKSNDKKIMNCGTSKLGMATGLQGYITF